jgi:hypothetical protein
MARRPPIWARPTVPIQPVQPFTDAITFTLTPSPPSLAQDVHTFPDDSNAVLNSGAMMTTAPRRLLLTNPEWENNIRPAPPGTALRYGNMETEPVEEVTVIGSYPLFIVPNRYHTALVYVHDISSEGRARRHLYKHRNNRQRLRLRLHNPHTTHSNLQRMACTAPSITAPHRPSC